MLEKRNDEYTKILNDTDWLSKSHNNQEYYCSIIYYILGCILVLLNLIISAFTGPKELGIFILSIIAASLGVILNFFKIEQKIQRHHVASFDYDTLHNDLKLKGFESNYDLKVEDLSAIYKRKKLIDKHAPMLKSCCDLYD